MSTIKMSKELNHNRRRFLRNATVAFAAAELAQSAPRTHNPARQALRRCRRLGLERTPHSAR
jgi:hypothetical protein